MELIKNSIINNKKDISLSIKNELVKISITNKYNNEFKNILDNCNITINNIEFISYIDYNDTFLISLNYNLLYNTLNYNGYLSFEINIDDDFNIIYILSDLIHNIDNYSMSNDEKTTNYDLCFEHYKKFLVLFHN